MGFSNSAFAVSNEAAKYLSEQKAELTALIHLISERKFVAETSTNKDKVAHLVTALSFYDLLRSNLVSEFDLLKLSIDKTCESLKNYAALFDSTTKQDMLFAMVLANSKQKIQISASRWSSAVSFAKQNLK